MPYLAHFGLKEHPFTLTPNIDFYYPTQETANIVASLDFALHRESGIVKVVGEVGTGKTLLCRLLMHKLEANERVAYINAPQADVQTIIHMVCEEFGLLAESKESTSFAALNRFLVETHSEGKLAVVVVDEAQHLGKEGLEAIRLISNLETERSKLLQIVLFGQTELDELLSDPSLRQINQRIVFSFNTKPLSPGEAKRYMSHRIQVSRQPGVTYEIYSDAALELIARRSGGIPRVVNILADKSLVVAFSEGSPTVQKAHVLSAVEDTANLVTRHNFSLGRAGWRGAVAASIAVIALSAGAYLLSGRTPTSAPPALAASVPAEPEPTANPPPIVTPPPTITQPPPAPPLPAAAPPPPAVPVHPPVGPVE